MEPDDIIQLLRTLSVAQIRQCLTKTSVNQPDKYDTISEFFIDCSKQEVEG